MKDNLKPVCATIIIKTEKHECIMLLTLEANVDNSSTKSLNKISNNSCNNNNDNNCLTTMTCLCGCISCCHSKAASKTSSTTTQPMATTTRKIAKTLTMIPAATALVLKTTTSTKTIISSSSSSPTVTTTMKTSTAASSSSTKDISNYMHCASSKCHAYICHNSDTNTNTNNSDSCHATCISNSFCSIINNSNNNNNNNNKNYKNIRNCIFNINNNFNKLIKLIIVLMFFTCCDLSQAALRDVNLYIEPPAVRRSQSVALHCHYTLEGAPLYSVKFYRGQLEFFRYTPGEYPNTKVFHYPGIKVDESVSNATQVIIRNVNFGLSGNFSCEVTADAPLFSTATAYAQMQVVEFPDKRPQLFTEHTRYEPGDVLRANCSTPPSRPRAELRFTINNMPVSSEETQYVRTVDNLIASRLSLKVQLQAIHFAAAVATAIGSSNSHMINALNGGGGTTDVSASYAASAYNSGGGGGGGSSSSASGGALVLRCTAQIGDLYQEYKEIELGTPQKDPIPARVTSSGGGFTGFLETYFGPSSTAAKVNFHNLPEVIMPTIMLIIMANYYQTR